MDKKLQAMVDNHADAGTRLARTQINNAIGEVTLALLAQGKALTLDALVQALDQQVKQRPGLRQRNEFAQTALRDAVTKAGR